jgi:hypothetical protein
LELEFMRSMRFNELAHSIVAQGLRVEDNDTAEREVDVDEARPQGQHKLTQATLGFHENTGDRRVGDTPRGPRALCRKHASCHVLVTSP